MQDRVKPSTLNRILTPVVFLLGGVCALAWFVYRIYALLKSSGDEIVIFDKGSYYLLGVAIGMLALAFVVIWEQWLLRPLSRRITKIFSGLAVASLVTLLAVPHIAHFVANEHLTASGYSVCEAASDQWLFIRDIVYVQPSVECSEDIKQE